MPRSLRWSAAPLAVALLVLSGACMTPAEQQATPLPAGGAEPTTGTAGPSGPTGTPSGTPTSAVNHADVLAVYAAWWRALQRAYATGDADEPALAEYAVDPILARQRASIRALRAQGVVQRTTFTLRPRLRVPNGRSRRSGGLRAWSGQHVL